MSRVKMSEDKTSVGQNIQRNRIYEGTKHLEGQNVRGTKHPEGQNVRRQNIGCDKFNAHVKKFKNTQLNSFYLVNSKF